jgi:hypothetical protein
MPMKPVISTLLINRNNLLKQLEGLSEEQLYKIPNGFNNNIIWNFGHIIVAQQMLTYGIAGVTLQIPAALTDSFKKATSPASWSNPFNIEELKALAISTIEQFDKDLDTDLFANYKPYLTSSGLTLHNIDDAIFYSHMHEGYHTGVIASIKNIIK